MGFALIVRDVFHAQRRFFVCLFFWRTWLLFSETGAKPEIKGLPFYWLVLNRFVIGGIGTHGPTHIDYFGSNWVECGRTLPSEMCLLE